MSARSLIPLVLPLLALSACEVHHEADEVIADICVSGAANTVDIDLMLTCLSSSQYDREFTCEAIYDGTDIVVTSLFTYTTKGNGTNLDCGTFSTSCAVVVPDDGLYTVVHNDDALDIELSGGDVVIPAGESAVCTTPQ